MKACRECQREISEQAMACPHCGAPFPAREKWDGFGFEHKSKLEFFGWPLLHVSFKYRPNRMPVPAKGIIAIGQFAISQFTIAGYAVAQFAIAYSLIAQFGLYLSHGRGQLVKGVGELIGLLWSPA